MTKLNTSTTVLQSLTCQSMSWLADFTIMQNVAGKSKNAIIAGLFIVIFSQFGGLFGITATGREFYSWGHMAKRAVYCQKIA